MIDHDLSDVIRCNLHIPWPSAPTSWEDSFEASCASSSWKVNVWRRKSPGRWVMTVMTNVARKWLNNGWLNTGEINKKQLSGSLGVPIESYRKIVQGSLATIGPTYQFKVLDHWNIPEASGNMKVRTPTIWISRNWFFIALKLSFPGHPHLHQNATDSHRWTWWRRSTETWKELRCASPFPGDD